MFLHVLYKSPYSIDFPYKPIEFPSLHSKNNAIIVTTPTTTAPPPRLLSPLAHCLLSMDPLEYPAGKSPRRELQGPRPAPLKVRKDSHKITKPLVAPAQHHHRPPVIIYTVSPKVIHTHPSEFMTLVQRLTGSSSTNFLSSFPDPKGSISPAARFASVEKTNISPDKKKQPQSSDMGMDMSTDFERSSVFTGILSPGPTSLLPIPPNFFSPLSDPNPMSFYHDLSPVLQGNRNYLESSFMPSPNSTFLSPHINSPNTPSLDLFNNFSDF
ncbi:protein MKS1-like [Actinidia eriantha]|uniref:protein MKS1-like n=1 Tax=Actinidia eriantha TaxID=165200 RepID=UPI00258AEABD|nr:protein MKS1-like [Actinidia eriantha]